MIAFKIKVVLHVLLNFHSKQTKLKGVSLIRNVINSKSKASIDLNKNSVTQTRY